MGAGKGGTPSLRMDNMYIDLNAVLHNAARTCVVRVARRRRCAKEAAALGWVVGRRTSAA